MEASANEPGKKPPPTYDTVENSNYKRSPHGNKDGTEFENEILMKRMKKINATSKPSTNQIKVWSKKCARPNVEKEGRSVNESPSATKHGQLSVV